jgi:S-adenosylmethionine:tRNA ribosyltransferase-isomerase
MIAASLPIQRSSDAKLLVIDAGGRVTHIARQSFVDLLRAGDLVVANDAATLPASLTGRHVRTNEPIEVRLAGRASLRPDDVVRFAAVVFGAGDFRTRTEDRALPPLLGVGDRLELGPMRGTVVRLMDHPRLIAIAFDGGADAIRAALASHGRPIQYAHVAAPLALWDVWTPVAAVPAAFEPPSAGFVLDWRSIHAMRDRGVDIARITLAAGISSTGDPSLDARLPFDEPYRIPAATCAAVERAHSRGGRVIAVGTTVVRALEHAAGGNGHLRAGEGVADQRIQPGTELRIVDALLSGTHEPGTSHHRLLGAFSGEAALDRADRELETCGYRTHEFGDSVFVERQPERVRGMRSVGSTAA